MTRDLFPDQVPIAVDPSLEALVRKREGFETPRQLVEAVLWAEILTRLVWEPAAGCGGIARVLIDYGHEVVATDIEDWGYRPCETGVDFLETRELRAPTIFMNPPFSLAEDFIRHALQLRARKVIVIQRRAYWEGEGREKRLWSEFPPNRIYTPVPRPAFWMFHIPLDQRGAGGETCHDVYVWEPNQPRGTLSGHLRMGSRPDIAGGQTR